LPTNAENFLEIVLWGVYILKACKIYSFGGLQKRVPLTPNFSVLEKMEEEELSNPGLCG